MPPVPFVGGAYQSRARRLNSQECINLYPELDGSGTGKAVAMLVGCPGLALFATVPGLGGIRALYATSDGRCVVVRGSEVSELYRDGSRRALGSLRTGSGPVSLADNGSTVVVVDGEYGYTWSLAGGSLTQIIDENFYGSPVVAFLDGYFVFVRPGTGQVYLSGLYDTTFDGLDFQTAEAAPDPLVTLTTFRHELRVFGTRSVESWYNAGGDPVFARNPSGYSDMGCLAAGSVAHDHERLFWLGANTEGQGVVYVATGFDVQRVSTHALEFALGQYPTVADATAWCYQQEGHQFYVLTLPTGNATWVYDATTQLWHRRGWWNTTLSQYDRHRASCHAAVFGEHLVGDWETGQVYRWSLDTYTDNGHPLRVLRAAPHLSAPDLYAATYHRFTLDAEVGVGLDGGVIPGASPVVALRWSNDGGLTWGDYRPISLGRLGQTQQRLAWHRLGQGRDRVFEVSSSLPVAQRWIQAHVVVTGGQA